MKENVHFIGIVGPKLVAFVKSLVTNKANNIASSFYKLIIPFRLTYNQLPLMSFTYQE